MFKTVTLYRNNDPSNKYPKGGRGEKWSEILGPIWRNIKKYMYEGKRIVVIPCDPNSLIERLDLSVANKEVGNTGVRNELVSICDELKRHGVLDSNAYKKLMSIL